MPTRLIYRCVRFPGLTHPGIVGTAPSMELLSIWNERERELEETGLQSLTLCEVLHSRPLAHLPSTKGCVLGKIKEGTREWERIAKEAARTIPGRENGGNCDIKNLSRGSKVYLPVFVDGANLSTGDMHFSQGDGEVAFCGAIEMSGFLELKVHYLSGPIRVVDTDGKPAKPGDLLVVEICNLGPLPGDEWGFTAIFDRENGGGFLTDHFPCATKAIWYFEGIYAYSPHIPGVRFPGLTHPGIVGTAPSMELLSIWNERERELEEMVFNLSHFVRFCIQDHLHTFHQQRAVFLIKEGTREWEKIAKEAARTIPGRENGGNCNIKNLSRGSKVYLPVFVDGANLSTGDMHFSQGDGEVAFCGAIEMSGFLELKHHENTILRYGHGEAQSRMVIVGLTGIGDTMTQIVLTYQILRRRCNLIHDRCEIIRDGMKKYLTPMGPTPLHVNPIFEIGPVEPRFSEWLVFEGISVDESGRQHYLDATVAYKRAVLNTIEYISRFGYSKEQVYLLLSCCPCEGRISGIVDSPNAVATLAIPIAIFDQDIRPKTSNVPTGPRLVRNPCLPQCTCDGRLPTTKNPCATTK
ncbi:hypothetical protein OROHE_019625 [Orobanche hederae]